MKYIQELEKRITQAEVDPSGWKSVLMRMLEEFNPYIEKCSMCLHSTEPAYKDFRGITICREGTESQLYSASSDYSGLSMKLEHSRIGEVLLANFDRSMQAPVLCLKLSETKEVGEYYSLSFELEKNIDRNNLNRVHNELQEIIRQLLPVLLKAIAHYISRKLCVHKNFLMTDMLDKIKAPAMFVNCDGTVLYANDHARTNILDQDNNYYLTQENTLSFRTRDKKLKIADILAEIYEDISRFDAVVQLSSPDAVYTDVMLIRRLGNSTASTPWKQLLQGPPCALAVIKKGEGEIKLPPELIRQGMGFTKRESELTSSLVNGNSLSDYSRIAGIKKETTRWHMKQIQQKTGASGQIDLVRRVMYQFSLYGFF